MAMGMQCTYLRPLHMANHHDQGSNNNNQYLLSIYYLSGSVNCFTYMMILNLQTAYAMVTVIMRIRIRLRDIK